MIALTMLLLMGNQPILNYTSPNQKMSPLFYLILVQCLLMAHLTISMQVNHITKTVYSPFRSRLMLVQLTIVFLIYFIHLCAIDKFNFDFFKDVIWTIFMIQVALQLHYLIMIVKEVSDALGIRVFCVKETNVDSSDAS